MPYLYCFYYCFLILFLLYIFLFIVLCVFLYFIITAALCVLRNEWNEWITTHGQRQSNGIITQYSISPNVQPLLTACSVDGVTLYSRSVTTPCSPRSNQPALTSSRRPGDPVYSRTVAVVVAFSSTIFNARSRRRLVVETTVVILNCPRHTV